MMLLAAPKRKTFGLTALLLSGIAGCQVIEPAADAFTADLPTDPPARSTLNEKQTAKLCVSTAEGLLAEGHDAKAAVLYEKARHHDRSVKVSHPLATAYARLGMPERATKEFEQAISEAPDDTDRLNDYGCFCLRRGDLEKAEELLNGALALQPSHPQALMNLGECYLRSGRTEQGIEVYTNHLGRAAALSNTGVVLAGLGQTEQAKYYLRQAISENPELPAARVLLAELEAAPAGDAG